MFGRGKGVEGGAGWGSSSSSGWWWWQVVVISRVWLSLGEEVGWWWCCGVVVVGERMCRGVHSVDIEKRYKKHLNFFCVIFECSGCHS
jgi:hypothetical protein